MNQALRLFEGTPPSAEHATAWLRYGHAFLSQGEGRPPAEVLAALHRALEVAEAAGAETVIPWILSAIANQSFLRGEVEDGFRLLAQARSMPEASRDADTILWIAFTETDALLTLGKLEAATQEALRGVDGARRGGMGSNFAANGLLGNAVEGLLGRGRTPEAAALIDPQITGPVDRNSWPLHACRADIDLLRGEVEAAAQCLRLIEVGGSLYYVRELGQRVAEVALWAGRPDEALEEVQRLLDILEDTCWALLCGWLLVVGMRACADLAERARARRHDDGVRAAVDAADNLASWLDRTGGAPFTDHPFLATSPAARAIWEAERGRAAGVGDEQAWSVAAEQWAALDYRHRAGYARWRQAEAMLATPHSGRGAAATALSAAAAQAVEHVPLMRAIEDLARRARIDLSAPIEPVQPERATVHAFGLTDRELDVLRLLGQGRTNPEIAAALFISPRTAGVHVTHILRKLDAATRVQAATIAERAGLLAADPTRPGAT
jgi:DNA-binding CsgD family transcriptional regulator/tetratricopeptide (TPR) repeat protein